ncbi:hypothetical protein K450DRAFT_122665 [Umbelopsis ramanniana AG]|uniref:Uncharacterized protein n=1 Tax=Umbelopsis ramanniana AG TaxID=1314678 RepID=A0AAD5E2N1_UMBRA|nr:uncharacterized protein K450DRAFT_122665 [Umbelopsis ramanniana AG]KAI8576463.1 hypothetical protein K450DRAFT_122665 [Umbelopsis ramanniana AG]
MKGHKEVVDFLIKHGAAVDASDEDLDTTLQLAARNGYKEVVDLLIQSMARLLTQETRIWIPRFRLLQGMDTKK